MLAACGNDSAESLLSSAKKYLKKNDSKAAIIQIKNSLQKSPDSAEARYLLGKTLLEGGDATGAAIELRKALDLQYPTVQVLPSLAKALIAVGEHKKLIDQYAETNLTDRSAAADLKTSLALSYATQGDAERMQVALQAAFQAVPDYPPALLLKARFQAAQGRLSEALALVDKAISAMPTVPEPWHVKAELLLYGKNNMAAAMEAYRKALELAPNYFPARSGMISLLLAQGDVKGAAIQLEALRKTLPQHYQTKYYEAHLAFLNHDYVKARDMIQRVLRVTPDNDRALQMAGAIEFETGALVQAESYLGKALQQTPGLYVARRLLVKTHLRLGQPAKALTVLKPVLDQAQPDVEALLLAVEAYTQAGEPKRADAYLAQVVKLNPSDVKTRSALALSRMGSDNVEATFSELRSIARSDKGIHADEALVNAYVRNNNLEEALKAIESIEAKQPDRPSTATMKGRVYLMKKDAIQARKSFERALEIDPAFVQAATNLAVLDVTDGKPEAARKRFESVLAKEPTNMQALLGLAGLQARLDTSTAEVEALLTKAIKLNPTQIAPRLSLIDFHLQRRDGKAALQAAQDATAVLQDAPELIDALGRAQMAVGESNQALGTFTKLVELQPRSPQGFLRLAEIHLAAKNLAAAGRNIRQALSIKPDLLAAQRMLIEVELANKRPQQALDIAREVQRQRPSDPIGLVLEGGVEAARQNLPAAAAVYRAALKKFDSPQIATKLHSVLGLLGKNEEAEKLVALWMQNHPKDVAFPFYMGEVSLSKKEFVAAEYYFRRVLQIQPENPLALNNVAWIMATLEKPGAVDLARKATTLAPDTPAFLDTLATALDAEHQDKQAIEAQKKALSLSPENHMFRFRLAKLYIKAGDKKAARVELNTLASLNEKFNEQSEVTELLKQL